MTTQRIKKHNRKQESPDRLDLLLAAWAIQDYDKIARLCTVQGASYMQDKVGRVPNDDLCFAPEIHVIKDNTLQAICAAGGMDIASQRQLVQKFLASGADGVLLITPATMSKMAANNPEKLPLKSFPDHITVSVGYVFIPPFELVSCQGLPVGTDEELKAAGFGKAAASAEAKRAA